MFFLPLNSIMAASRTGSVSFLCLSGCHCQFQNTGGAVFIIPPGRLSLCGCEHHCLLPLSPSSCTWMFCSFVFVLSIAKSQGTRFQRVLTYIVTSLPLNTCREIACCNWKDWMLWGQIAIVLNLGSATSWLPNLMQVF